MRKLNTSKLLGHDYFSEEHDGHTIYKPGFSYMKRFDDKYRKVKVQSIEVESVKSDDRYENVIYIEYSFVEKGEVGDSQIEKLPQNEFWARSIPHCWECKRQLDEEVMDYCEKCLWIICPEDGACDPNCEKNPNWYKRIKVTDAVKKTYEINIVQPEHSDKPEIFCDVVVTSNFGTFVFEGYYSNETDCVYVEPKYVNTYIDKDGIEQKRSAVVMNSALHAHVLQALDAILE
jgi:hypothetical protein